MLARLTIHVPFKPTRSFLVHADAETVVGRDPDCSIVLDDDRVSRRHARLTFTDGSWRLTDLQSTNGTSRDGSAIANDLLGDDDWLSFGGVLARFERSSSEREEADSRQREERLRSSISLQRDLDPELGVERLLSRLLGSVLDLSGTTRGVVLLRAADGAMSVAASRNLGEPDLLSERFAGSVGAIERAVATGRPVAVSDARLASFLNTRESVTAGGIRALVCIPMKALDRLAGVLYADSPVAGTTFSEMDVEILETLAAHAALAIVTARRNEELKGLSSKLGAVSRPEGTSWSRVVAHHDGLGGALP